MSSPRKFCHNCGAEIDARAEICPSCGLRQLDIKKPEDGRKYSNLGIVFAVISLLILPIIFGPIGVILGVLGYMKGDEKRGIIAIILSVILAIISWYVAYVAILSALY